MKQQHMIASSSSILMFMLATALQKTNKGSSESQREKRTCYQLSAEAPPHPSGTCAAPHGIAASSLREAR